MLINKNLVVASLMVYAVLGVDRASADPVKPEWTGPYVGADIGNRHESNDGVTYTIDPNSNVGGSRASGSGSDSWNGIVTDAHIGYNWQTKSNIVLGIETSVYWSNNNRDRQGISEFGISDKHSNQSISADLKARVGYAFNKLLIYGTGGASWMHVRTTNTQGPCGDGRTPPSYTIANCSAGPYTAVPYGTLNVSSASRLGWTLGGGAELALTRNISARVGYTHADYGTFRFAYPSFNRGTNAKTKTDDIMAGLNFRF
ncbi:outer membrane beta-barrel protein [Sphingomonas sp. RT2P30]|uniref:outer membrane protein n=1 Tax=Parasphingomonas halimpatiens TaxID=3096162 RepID=UPI002FCAE072